MSIEEFLGWRLQGNDQEAFNVNTGQIINIVSGFTETILKEYQELKTDKEKQNYLETKNISLWTRGFFPQGTPAYEFGSVGDITHETCKEWIPLNRLDEIKESNKEIWNSVRFSILERRVSDLEMKLYKIYNSFQ